MPSAETVMFENSEREEFEQNRKIIAKEVLGKLTETQRRRYILHVVKGLTTREIADLEGVLQNAVMDSIKSAEKKIKKF